MKIPYCIMHTGVDR